VESNHGSLANAIVASVPQVEGPELENEAQDLNADDVAVDEIFSAMENKDKQGFRDALRSFIEMSLGDGK